MRSRYPFSAGESLPGTQLPEGACDAHVHVYDSSVPAAPGARLQPPHASIDDYKPVQARMGTTRTVLVTPSTYGSNNAPMLAALAALGPSAKGVAVTRGDESDAHLRELHALGVCGVRINLSMGAAHDAPSIAHMADRIAPLGWHLQLLMPTDQLLTLVPLLRSLPVDLVFDHFARIAPAQSGQRAHALVLELLHNGRAWVKLSGGYLVSATLSTEDPALDALARSYIDAAPDRVVWGSDWPHATASAGLQPMPDDARQIDRLAQWAGSTASLRQILVTNPERLYGFDPIPQHQP